MALVLMMGCSLATAARAFLLPEGFGPVGWQRDSLAVINQPEGGEALVWLGQVESFHYRLENDKVILTWTCREMAFASPGPSALDSRPIQALPAEGGRFQFDVVTSTVTAEQAAEMTLEMGAKTHYALIAGTLESINWQSGDPVVVLKTRKFEVHENLVQLLPET